ncbi:hypothetical protein MKW92_019901 [Papaver armeniacum]|nr:hypothetical protein MKW92_019901 [Papaver armeniacum]
MGASRKLQGEIDRVLKKFTKVYDTDNANQKEKFEAYLKKEIKKLQRYRDQIKTWIQSSEIKDKKVSASYEQALLDARKIIEREMERFKVCEKETKTKAFSKEGLGQQPKTDPKEKAKLETREWLNTVVGELESQIDSFEADIEGLSVKKGKARPPRLTHLETSIVRHKAHIMKLELILRLLDNDELKFSEVDDLYSSLDLDKVELLEDLVTIPPGLVKGVGTASAVLSMKPSVTSSPTQVSGSSTPDQVEETASQDSNSDIVPRTPPSKNGILSQWALTTPTGTNAAAATSTMAARSAVGVSVRGVGDTSAAVGSSSPISVKEEEDSNFSSHRSSPVLADITLGRSIGKGTVGGGTSTQSLNGGHLSTSSVIPSSPGSLGGAPTAMDMPKRNILGAEIEEALLLILLPQVSKSSEGAVLVDSANASEPTMIGGKVFSPQWRPHAGSSFQNPNEVGQVRARTEIAPDQRDKYLQRFQQVQQQGHSNLIGVPHLSGGNQFFPQQQNTLLQQFNSQSQSLSPQVGLGLGVQTSGLNSVTSASSQQPNSVLQQQSTQHSLMSAGSKDSDFSLVKVEDQQQQQNSSDHSSMEPSMSSGFNKNLMNEDDLKAQYAADTPAGVSSSLSEATQTPRDIDLSPGQPLQSNQPSGSLGVIGRRSVSDLGAIGDSLSASTANSGGSHDQLYNLQMLEAAYYKLPQPKDSERAKTYIPRHPVATPPSYPQVQSPIVDNPAFWERLGLETLGTDTLFFAFYYQQNTYQQYLAARELKKQSWRYHRKYNTWFQRHEEPKVANDEYEQGTYVYFDFHILNDEKQHGWCQRIKTEFTFEYSYLEDELVV